jgi:acyloxyacyl hydrolase
LLLNFLLVVDIVEQLAVIHSATIEQVLDKICTYFPSPFDSTCQNFVNTYGPMIIAGFAAQDNSDDICNAIKICQTPDTDQCRLQPVHPSVPRARARTHAKADPQWKVRAASIFPKPPTETPWQWIMDLINRLAQKHEPVVDIDRDMYSDAPHLRGSTWRGKDCNDLDAKVHPGAGHNPYKGSGADHDCNGIYGMAPDGLEWDQKLCKGSKQTGVVVMVRRFFYAETS